MGLVTYRKKRDFDVTPEPKGKRTRTARGSRFVIQKHAARRLHYDFRLEMDGVLKSWAVTRGPSLAPGEKRLAVHVEDHPLEYGDFEGTIPQGEYGGGAVLLWDRGRWKPVGDARKGYAKGHLEFELEGEKLRGRWRLIRMPARPRDKKENWLLIKAEDDAARPPGAPDILEERPESVKTGRFVEEIAGEEPGWSSQTGRIKKRRQEAKAVEKRDAPDASKTPKAKRGPLPDFIEPTLATLARKPPAGREWIHEIKFDGYRLQIRIEPGRVKIFTRSGLNWTAKFGKPLIEAFKELPVEKALIDGELVAETDNGASNFSALQAALSEGRFDRFRFYAFDLLYLNGYDLRQAPLHARKEALKSLIGTGEGLLRFSEHFEERGDVILEHACRLGLEGIVSKLKDGLYRSGRCKSWIKSKCSQRQEFVIGGYVDSTTSRKAIGSLLLGYCKDGKLIYVGKVGTGFNAAVAADLHRRLERIRIPSSPFAAPLTAEEARRARFVKPHYVAEIEYRSWTADKHLRHASFQGLREDKPAVEVVREEKEMSVAKPALQPSVKLTHPDRVYWPDAGVTKQGLADYYSDVWPRLEPLVIGRPLALVRCPDGIDGECFFQKHAWQGLSKAIRLVDDPHDKSNEPILMIDNFDGMMGLVQGGALEIHPWGATFKELEQPDMIIMDLDPGEGAAWKDVIAAALEVRERLRKAGLASFVKMTGGKGLHAVAPLTPKADWAAVKAFTKRLAEEMAADSPEKYVSTASKSKRVGKILVDYLRNGRGATAVAAYSTRARPGATVSMPLAWEELNEGLGPNYFTVGNAAIRLNNLKADPWAEFRKAAAPLPRG